MKWFSSDWHISHAAIMRYCSRPFSTVEDMNAAILDGVLSNLKSGDELYNLGDLGFDQGSLTKVLEAVRKHGVMLHVILGNHDRNPVWLKGLCQSTSTMKTLRQHDLRIEMCHYPMVSWNCSCHGAWLLHGHHHHDISAHTPGKVLNVGVDLHNFKPISLDQVVDMMKLKPDNWDTVRNTRP